MKKSNEHMYYPQRPWPLDNISNHPAFMRHQRDSADNTKPAELFFGLAHIASLPEWSAGGTLSDFMATFGDRADSMLAELIRMNVFILDTAGTVPMIVPCTEVAAVHVGAKEKKITSFYLPVELLAKLKMWSQARNMAASQFVIEAIEMYGAGDTLG